MYSRSTIQSHYLFHAICFIAYIPKVFLYLGWNKDQYQWFRKCFGVVPKINAYVLQLSQQWIYCPNLHFLLSRSRVSLVIYWLMRQFLCNLGRQFDRFVMLTVVLHNLYGFFFAFLQHIRGGGSGTDPWTQVSNISCLCSPCPRSGSSSGWSRKSRFYRSTSVQLKWIQRQLIWCS